MMALRRGFSRSSSSVSPRHTKENMPTGSIASSSTQVDPERPWLGLRSFDENASAYFFGRDAELRDIFERVQHRPLTVLFGQSGLGKTSLLRAGLVPRLRDAGFLPVVLRLEYEEGDPSPADQLRETLIQAARDGGVTLPRELPTDLWLLLHDPHYGFCADPSAASSATLPRPVLILDQFEEIFTLGERRPNAAEELCAALAVLAENRAPADLDARLADDDDLALRLRHDVRPVRVILSLREDFLHMLERWKRAVPAVMENRLELRLLTGPQALQAAIEPGKLRCRASSLPPIVSGTTGAAIVRFVADVAPEVPLDEIDAVPPLLSLLCAELNEQRGGPEDVIRPEQLRGRAEDILEKFYHRCFASHPSAVQVFVEERLLSPEGFRESTAEDTARHDLERAGLSTADANAALKKLVDDRLLVVEERGGIRRVELTHDVLTGIARRSRDFRREREATAARRRARSRLVVISIVIVSLVACVSGFVAYWTERQNAELKAMIEEAARSDRLVALDKIQSGEHADALAHLGRAHRYLPSSSLTAEIALPLILSSPLRSDLAVFRGHGGPVSSARFSADGKRVLTASDDKTARLWEAESGKLLASYEGHGGPVYSAQFSPDGKRVLTASDDKTARLWEAESGKLLASYEGHGGPVYSAQFSADGKRVLTASYDKTARLWEAESGKLLASYEGHGGPVYSAQFSPDGKRVLTTSDDKTARLWPLLPANVKPAEWFGDFLTFLGGQRIGEDGEMKILSNSERHAVESKLRQFARVKDDYSLLLRWQLTTTSDRTVDPYGTITQKQLASELISRGQDRDAMQRAYNLDPWNPVVHLALAEFEEDLEASDWLRHYSLDRLPDDPVLERQAADMLRKQHQPELALECIDRALKHTPQDPDALALRTAILKDLNR